MEYAAPMSQQSGDLIKFLRSLRAIREYAPEPVPEGAVNDILEVGRWSGTASNRQPVEVVVVRDREIKQKITEGGVRAAAESALAFVLVTTGDPERHDLEVFDEGRIAERLMLAAHAHGLGTCVGTLKGDGPNVIRQALGIPPERRVYSVVTVGHVDAARKGASRRAAPGRKPIAEFAHWDRY